MEQQLLTVHACVRLYVCIHNSTVSSPPHSPKAKTKPSSFFSVLLPCSLLTYLFFPLSLLNTTLDMEMDGKIQIKKLAMD
jgi:hypothetical protein